MPQSQTKDQPKHRITFSLLKFIKSKLLSL